MSIYLSLVSIPLTLEEICLYKSCTNSNYFRVKLFGYNQSSYFSLAISKLYMKEIGSSQIPQFHICIWKFPFCVTHRIKSPLSGSHLLLSLNFWFWKKVDLDRIERTFCRTEHNFMIENLLNFASIKDKLSGCFPKLKYKSKNGDIF